MFWSARQGRWAWAGLCGALAGATRSTGLMLIVPALLLYLYGPREDRPPDRPAGGPAPAPEPRRVGSESASMSAEPRPRRPPAPAAGGGAAALSDPARGAVARAASGGGRAVRRLAGTLRRRPARRRSTPSRRGSAISSGPTVGVWDGLRAGFDGARQLLSFQRGHVYFPLAAGSPFIIASHNLLNLAFLLAAVPAFVGVLRRLPLAYGAYAIAAIALPLSYPVAPQPLMSIPRYLVVLFPLGIWLAAWLAEHPRLQRPALASRWS